MDSLGSIVNVRRLDRLLPWIGALVLVVGVATFLVVHFARSSSSSTTSPAVTPAVSSAVRKKVPLPAGARHVAVLFLQTAVARQNLARSYGLATPALRQGVSRKQWLTGNIPVQYYPVNHTTLSNAKYQVDYSYAKDVQLRVLLLKPEGAKVEGNGNFVLELVKRGGLWKVDYIGPGSTIPVPNYNS